MKKKKKEEEEEEKKNLPEAVGKVTRRRRYEDHVRKALSQLCQEES